MIKALTCTFRVEVTRLYSNTIRTSEHIRAARQLAVSTPRPETPPSRPRLHQRRLTPEERRELVAEYQAGGSIHGLSRKWGICRETVRRAVRTPLPTPRARPIARGS